MSHFYLEVISGCEPARRYRVEAGAVSIGRNQQNSIVLPPGEKSVSSHHAILYWYPDRITLQDLQSTNGTFVNDVRIDQQDITTGDTIGLGKSGPRLRLLESREELPDSPAPQPSSVSPLQVPGATEPAGTRRTAAADTPTDRHTPPLPLHPRAPGGSQTMELEQKLVHRRLDGSDMKQILRKDGRLERMLERGNIDNDQAHLLKTMKDTHHTTSRHWLVLTACTVSAALLVSGFFAVRSMRTQATLNRLLSLEQKLDDVESTIAQKRRNPEENHSELKRLIAELEQTQGDLISLRQDLGSDGFPATFDDPIEQGLNDILRRFGETQYRIPPEMLERVRHHVEVYTGRMAPTIRRFLKLKDRYFPLYFEVFSQQKLPVELAYVSMLESGFDPLALSHAGARGLWQFMPATARRYGLRVDDRVDERTDPLKSTHAAAAYFKDLISIFGGQSSLMLAMAAYNAGEGRIMGALRRIDDPMRNRDFWYIYRMGVLAEETNEYIPRILSLIIITENARFYGMADADGGVETRGYASPFPGLQNQ